MATTVIPQCWTDHSLTGGRRVGYTLAIAGNAIGLWVVHQLGACSRSATPDVPNDVSEEASRVKGLLASP